MDASTRLYARLGEIPEDPEDPESLDDLIVCAFGAFERYYLCWKTKGGKFRQDGYDLPPALNEWLNPTDGTARDWASLQVVFGRGEEYFASDSNGKLEFKEPEAKRTTEDGEKEKGDRQALRRSRTVSFLRPFSQTSIRSENTSSDILAVSRRTPSISSQRASRPPSLSYSSTGSDVSIPALNDTQMQQGPQSVTQILFNSQLTSSSQREAAAAATGFEDDTMHYQSAGNQLQSNKSTPAAPARGLEDPNGQTQVLHKDQPQPSFPTIPEEAIKPSLAIEAYKSGICTCGCHDPPLSKAKRPTYANASVQTDPISRPSRASLRVDTSSASSWVNHGYSAIVQDVRTPVFDSFGTVPFSMGRMTNYFNKPGYQLGDSLASGYHYYEEPVYQYQEEFGDEALR